MKLVVLTEEQLEDVIARAIGKARLLDVDGDKLTKEQVAKMLGKTTRTITTYMHREGMPHRMRGGRAEFDRNEVLAWWREQGRLVPLKAV